VAGDVLCRTGAYCGGDKNVDTLIADFGAIIDAEQNELNRGVSLLEWRAKALAD
jgi:hypothetical protein